MIGRTISHFRILEKLGAGAMGVVYKAEDTQLNRPVALKFLSAELIESDVAKQRFIHEARAASAIQHHNICTIHEVGESDEGHVFICMDYYEGETLKDKIARGPLSFDEAVEYTVQVAQGLAEAHDRGTLHRDIKPANILVTVHGVVKILDFGLAKLVGQTKLTRSGTTVGTAAYMSPEQIRGEELDQRSDVFSLGVLFYELLTGAAPFAAEHEPAVMHKILNVAPPPLRSSGVRMAEKLEPVVGKMLAKERDARYGSMREVIDDLMRLRHGTEAPSARSRKIRLGVGLVSLLVLTGVGVYFLAPKSRHSSPDSAVENRLAVMRFDNLADRTDPHQMGDVIANLLATGLSQSRELTVVSSQRVQDLLEVMGVRDTQAAPQNASIALATRAGAKWLVTGSVLQESPSIVLAFQVVEVESGSIVAGDRIANEAGQTLFTMVDTLSAMVTRALSISTGNDEIAPISDVTTSSLDAYRYYLQGMHNFDKWYKEQAADNFRDALKYDSTFAMAHLGLAMVLGDYSAAGRQAFSNAIKYGEKTPDKEKHFIRAVVKADYENKLADAIVDLEALVARYPDEKYFFYLLANWYGLKRQNEERVASAQKALELDPSFKPAYNELSYGYQALGDMEQSLWAINKYIELAPDEANPYDTRGDLYAMSGRIDDAINSYRQALAIKPDFYSSMYKLGHMFLFKGEYEKAAEWYRATLDSKDVFDRALARLYLACIPVVQGRMEEALGAFADGIAADKIDAGSEGAGTWADKFVGRASLYSKQGKHDLALAEIEAAMHLFRDWPLPFAQRGMAEAAGVLARSGDAKRAQAILDEIGEKAQSSAGSENYWVAKGWLDMKRGDFDAAIADVRNVPRPPTFWARYSLAIAYLEAGRLAEALSEFNFALQDYTDVRAYSSPETADVLYYVGLAHDRAGSKEEAIKYYRLFLEQYRNADPGIEEVEDARRRVSTLTPKRGS